ncbi:MAG: carbon starvation CstA family protein [Planctomycetota bacterium]|jgi:carbon starvation protein
MAALVAVCVLVCFFLGYRFYARFIGERIYRDQEDMETPAHEFEDGRDFVPTHKQILFGHHFTSIAGAAPIIGPCVAAYWGILPALVWVVLGTIFMGAVHDFGALVVSIRERGRSIADIAGKVITPRVRLMFLCFVMVLIWLVLAVFAMAIAGLWVSTPSSVLPVNVGIVIAMLMGWLLYVKKVPALVPSLIALGLLYVFIWVGTELPINFKETADVSIFGFEYSKTEAERFWIIFLFVYCAIASLLPVWLLLQPRDYVNSHQLLVGLSLLFLGLLWRRPDFDAPWIRTGGEGAPPIIPMLFVTIACGAISGFHGLVSSGTTSKQIGSIRHARFIGYGGMLGEGSLALASALAAVAGIGLVGACQLIPGSLETTDLTWSFYYSSWKQAGALKAKAFVLGGGQFLREIGIPASFAVTMMAVLVISFAATTLDTATRIQRFIISELGMALRIKPLTNPYLATLLAVVPAAALVFMTAPDPATGQVKQVGWILWPVFGASNQMLAALTLLVLVLYFWQRKRPILPLLIPMLLITVITIWAILLKTGDFLAAGNWLLVGLNGLMLALILWMLLEGVAVVMKMRHGRGDEDASRRR